ncbi:efflux RND transporter periplasmic adaptor subunit [Arenicella sp. 4NH20-0111]|uniref:efflux RND transporter periplasmic adaptor subunit n=1 Tax=Arenicella sp. 4NH20-0111 TaxID=3127648 RepID=UPI00310ACDD4
MMITRTMSLVILSIVLIGCAEETSEEVSVRTVRTLELGLESTASTRTFNGQARTDRVIDLSFRASGVITLFNIKLGQAVKKGDLLAELDNVAARLAYEQANASLNSAKSNLDTQNLSLKRVQNLYEKGGASLSDYEGAKNAYRNAQASYRSSQRSVDIQQEQIRYGKIFAPEDGVISAVNKELEENTSSGEPIAVLNAGAEMEIDLGVPENVINSVTVGSRSTIRFAALANQLFEGIVTEVAPSIDQQSATYPVRVRVVEATKEVRSGMAASVVFDFSQSNAATEDLRIPVYAVGEDVNGRYAFVVERLEDGNTIARKRAIEIGELVNNAFEVKSGLEVGDIIVTAGVHSVLDGQQVRLPQ